MTYYADLTAESGKTYSYIITPLKGTSSGTESPGSSIRVSRTDSGFSTSSLRADILTLGIVGLRWQNPAISDIRYRILQRRRVNTGAWQRVSVLEPDATTYLDMKAPQGGRYEYRLVDGSAEGEVGPLSTVTIEHPSFNGNGRDGGARWNDIYYLLIPHDGRIRRFDLKTETWLPDLLPRVPEAITHLHVSDLGIFFSSSSQIYRIPLEGGETESVYNYGAWSFWTSGVRLHLATANNTIISIALAGPDVGKPEIRSLVAAEPWSIHLSPDRTRVFGCSRDGSFITLLEEIEPGKFVTQRYRGTALPGSPSRAFYLSAADTVIDTNGNTYRSYDLLPTGRPRLGVSHVEETESGFALLLQGGSLYCYDEYFDSQGLINPNFGGVTFAHHADDVWFFRFDATAPGCWIEHHEDAAPLGIPVFDPNDPDPFFGEPKAHVVDALGRHWSIHSQQRQLVPRTPGQVGTGARLDLGGTFVAEAFDPATQLLAVIIRNARGEPEMRIFDLSNPALSPVAFMLPAGSHSLAWVNGKLLVNGSEAGAVYLPDGTSDGALPAAPDRSRTLDVPAAGVTATLSPSGEYLKLTVQTGATQFTESFTGETGLVDSVLVASPEQDRLFTWPGGLRLLSAPATTIPMNCFQPIGAAWAGDRLLIIDRQAPGSAWLVSYNSQTGREIDRRPVKDSRLLRTAPGGVVDLASLDNSRRLQFTRFTPELDIASHGSGREPSLLPNAMAFTWVTGAKARLQTRVDGDGPMTYEWLKDDEVLPGV
ncbi:MAG: hypothetical protein EOP83_17095 [Verrucomicrobiaceae bacterium]|nr:MAG: hypothetical protein EOP83_17095 [Verrucomicrobiaceae bacterium]